MHSGAWLANAEEKVADFLELVCVGQNPIDSLWEDRPTPSPEKIRLMGNEWVGQSSLDKRGLIGKSIAESGADCAVITALDSICWLLNIRGSDVSRLPVVLSHAIIHANGSTELFVDSARIPDGFDQHVAEGVTVISPESLSDRLIALNGKKVILDATNSNAWFGITLEKAGAEVIDSDDPCLMPKAAKNSVEAEGMRQSHIRDGVAW